MLLFANSCTTSQGRTHFHGKVDSHVDIFCPNVVGWFGVQDGEDTAVQVGLASCLGVTGHSEDRSTGPVPGDLLGRPAKKHATTYEQQALYH